jgi:hypothetical protein
MTKKRTKTLRKSVKVGVGLIVVGQWAPAGTAGAVDHGSEGGEGGGATDGKVKISTNKNHTKQINRGKVFVSCGFKMSVVFCPFLLGAFLSPTDCSYW